MKSAEAVDGKRFRDFLRAHGHDLSEMGITGRALSFPEALEAMLLLRGTTLAILGGDILESAPRGLRHTYDNWSSEPLPGERFQDFCERSQAEAIRFIQQRMKDSNGRWFAHLVESDEENFSRIANGLT